MSDEIFGLCVIGGLFAMLGLRAPVWLALAFCGIAGNYALSGGFAARLLAGATPFDQATNYNLSVVPLFVLMGEVASSSRLSTELFLAARRVLSGVKGGLALAAIGASGAFGTVCGSSVATAATMTRISLPEMRRAGYRDGFAAASVAAGGTLGILIPPSIILVIYAAIAEESLRTLFAAAFVPGLVLALLYIAVALVIAARDPDAPVEPGLPLRARIRALAGPWQFALIFGLTIGGIYAGLFSPNEAAAIGALMAIGLGFAAGRLDIAGLRQALKTTAVTTAMLFLIVIGATMLANFVVQTRLPQLLIDTATAAGLAPLTVMLLILVLYLVLGCFLEGIGMVLITVPVFLPVVVSFGYDPVWFGILVVIVVEIGLISPPVGMNIFVIQAQFRDLKLTEIWAGILPFLLAPLILVALLFLMPGLALWLPGVLQ